MQVPSLSPNPLLVLLSNLLAGFGLAALAVAALLLADPGGAGGLLLRGAGHPWPVALLWLFLGLTCGAVQFGVALQLWVEAPPSPRLPRRWPVSPACAPALTRCARGRSR